MLVKGPLQIGNNHIREVGLCWLGCNPTVIPVAKWSQQLICDKQRGVSVSECISRNPTSQYHKTRPRHDDVIKWKHFRCHWPFVWGIHRSPVNSPHKSQWRGALMFSLIWVKIKGWVNNGEAGDSRRNGAHYDVIVMEASDYCKS